MDDGFVPYPMFVNLRGKHCVVVGGGEVAARKIAALLEAGGRVTVISPAAVEPIERWAERGRLTWVRSAYDTSALQSATAAEKPAEPPGPAVRSECAAAYAPFLVVAATNDREVNRRVAADAASLRALVDVVDDPGRGDFISPAIVRRGRLTIAVSTAGASPTVTQTICRQIGEMYGEEYAAYLDLLARLRSIIQERVPDAVLRRRLLREIARWDLLAAVRSCRWERVKEELVREFQRDPSWKTAERWSAKFGGWKE